MAAELAPQVDLSPGTARTYLYAELEEQGVMMVHVLASVGLFLAIASFLVAADLLLRSYVIWLTCASSLLAAARLRAASTTAAA